ncbi:MAG: SDR family oxidoreductase [Polyangiaceae bacterium]
MRPLVLITGASSGIGLATALACAEAGFEVVATMRNLERRAELEARASAQALLADGDTALDIPAIHLEQLDVTAPDVDDKVRELLLKYGPIENLVNNAGIGVGGVFEEQSDQDVRDQFETNVFGVMAVTRALLPAMRAARHGRIVNVSSLSGSIGVPGLSVYSATKHALEGFSEALHHEVVDFGVQVSVVAPGTIRTAIFEENQRRGALIDPEGAYGALSGRIEKQLLEAAASAPGPEIVGRRIAELLREPAPPLRTIVGGPARAVSTLRRVVPDGLFASGMRRLLGL